MIIDYNLGNPRSIKNMLSHMGFDSLITSELSFIENANRIILPGVGNFQQGISQLEKNGLIGFLKNYALEQKKPILGICLGMQLLTNFSEEGGLNGLGFIDAKTRKFQSNDKSLKIPHMGWNTISFQKDSLLNRRVSEQSRYYFAHSYFVECFNQEDILCTTHYGHEFVSGFHHHNIFGLQFHPEKSHRYGMEILANFCKV